MYLKEVWNNHYYYEIKIVMIKKTTITINKKEKKTKKKQQVFIFLAFCVPNKKLSKVTIVVQENTFGAHQIWQTVYTSCRKLHYLQNIAESQKPSVQGVGGLDIELVLGIILYISSPSFHHMQKVNQLIYTKAQPPYSPYITLTPL